VTVPESAPEASNPHLPAATTPSRNSRLRWWIHLAVIGAYPLVIGILSLTHGPGRAPALAHDAPGLVRACVFQLVIFAAIFALGWLASRASSKDLLLQWKPGVWPVPLGFLYSIGLRVGLALIAIFVIISLLLSHLIKPDDFQRLAIGGRPNVQGLVDISSLRRDPLYLVLNLTLVSFVVAGLREELWRSAVLAALRALWPQCFGSKPGEIAAVGVAAAIFGIGHSAQGAVAVAAAALLGFGLGTIMILHRSIWPAIIAHGFFDAATLAALPWLFEKLPQLR